MSARPKRGLGAKMAGGNPDPTRGREEDDFYPTPPLVTRAIVLAYPHLQGQTVWEPCAGDGAMADALLAGGVGRVVCSDINPRPRLGAPYRILQGDALAVRALPRVDAIITNPPFIIAERLIRHIMTLPNGPPQYVAMVLKGSYWHAATRKALFEEFPPTTVHPLRWRPDFKDLGGPTMEFQWSVWDAAEEPDSLTTYEPLDRPVL